MDKRTDQQLNKAAPMDFVGKIKLTEEESNYLSYLAGDVHDRAAAQEHKFSMFSPASNGSREPSKAALLAREINSANNRSAFGKTMDSIKGVFSNIFDKKTQNEQEGLPSRGGSTASFEQFEVPNKDQDVKKGNKFDNDGLQR